MNYTFIIVYMYYVTERAKFCQSQNFPFVRCCQSDNSDKTNKRDRITNVKVRSLCFCFMYWYCSLHDGNTERIVHYSAPPPKARYSSTVALIDSIRLLIWVI